MFTSVASKFRCFERIVPHYLGTRCHQSATKFTKQSRSCFCTNNMDESLETDVRNVDVTQGRQFLFDTYKTVKSMEAAGIPTVQAETLMNLMVQIQQAQLDHMNKNLMTKAQQEIAFQHMMSHVAAIRKDMIILERSEFSQLKHEYQTQHIELEQQKDTLSNELERLQAGVKLDLNLEKARTREDHGQNEKNLAVLQNKLDIKMSEVQSDISRLDSKIEREIANLLATYERYRNDVIRYAAGTIISCLTICLGFYRLWLK